MTCLPSSSHWAYGNSFSLLLHWWGWRHLEGLQGQSHGKGHEFTALYTWLYDLLCPVPLGPPVICISSRVIHSFKTNSTSRLLWGEASPVFRVVSLKLTPSQRNELISRKAVDTKVSSEFKTPFCHIFQAEIAILSMSGEFDIDEWDFDRRHFMQFFVFKKHFFFLVVINRLKTSEIISVIPRPWQVVVSVSAPVSAGGSAQLLWWPSPAPPATAMLSANSQKSSWSKRRWDICCLKMKQKLNSRITHHTVRLQLCSTTADDSFKSI